MGALSAGAAFLPQAISALGAMKGGKAKKATPAVPMPDEDEIKRSRKRSPSRGRASTILTGTDDGLGG